MRITRFTRLTRLTVMATAAALIYLTPLGASAENDVTVPMQDFGGRPVIELKINGAGPYRVIVDTGASRTIIDPSWVGGVTGETTLKSIEIGAMKFENVNVGAQALLGGVPDEFPKGVLSAAQFPGYLMTFDFPAKTLSLHKGALPAADGKRIFQYGADEVLPVAPITVAGHEYVIHVDTGSPVAVMLPVRYAKELPLTGELVQRGRARTGAGTFDVFVGTVNGSIALGDFPISGSEIRFSDLRPGPEPGIGNMGSDLLKAFKLTFDPANRRLRFERA